MFTKLVTVPPDQFEIHRIPLDEIKAKNVQINQKNISHIDLFNDSTNKIYLGKNKKLKPESRITMDIADTKSIPAQPKLLYAQPESVTTPPGVLEVTIWYYSDELMAEIREEAIKFWRDIFSGLGQELTQERRQDLISRLPFRR